jgi:citrate lyase subunit beta/citryl-CoA lyase
VLTGRRDPAAGTRVRARLAGDFTLTSTWREPRRGRACPCPRHNRHRIARGGHEPLATEDGVYWHPVGAQGAPALGFGFQGKMCIHPDQIAIVNRVFTPSDEEIAFAERVAAAFVKAEAEGSAAIRLDGKFIDYPIVYRAQRVLQRISAIRAWEGAR